MSLLALPLTFALFGCDNSAAEALKTCEGGNMEACYRDGHAAAEAARPRFSDARRAFSNACMTTHHPQACNELGGLVRDAKGGPKDIHRATELFEIACKGGEQTACIDLGVLVYAPQQGIGIEPEPGRAVELFTNACNLVDLDAVSEDEADPLAAACRALGRAYEEGKGLERDRKDPVKAAELYRKACKANLSSGCVSAGALAERSKRRADIESAAASYERACKLDARTGCFELAELHARRAWPDASFSEAALNYQRTCSIDPTRGCFEAAALMQDGKVDAREGEIEYLYNLACEHGHTVACTRRHVK